jgi:hypothetical protein
MDPPEMKDTVIKSTLFEDNNGAITTAHTVKISPHTKDIDIKYHFFKSHIHNRSGIFLSKIDMNLQKADIFTKGLGPLKFVEICKLLCGW